MHEPFKGSIIKCTCRNNTTSLPSSLYSVLMLGILIPINSPCTCIAATDQIYAGQESGIVSVIDPRTSKAVTEIEAHPGGVSSIWAEGQLLVTAGLTYKQEMHVPDNALRLYDLRTMKMIMPWPIPLGASAVKISQLPSRIIYALCPLSYQIASVHLDREPLVRQTIPLAQNDDVLCFDVSPNNDSIAYGTVLGALNLISCAPDETTRGTSYSTTPLRYPEDNYNVTNETPASSNWLGDDRFWGRSRPLTDSRLYASAQIVDGIGYSRNDRGILPNQVHIANVISSGFSNPQAKLFGMTMLDSDVPSPFWNQIIRALRQSNFFYNQVIDHCNSGCGENVDCFICELALIFQSLNVASSEPIHIQYFLKSLAMDREGMTMPEDMQLDIPVFRKIEKPLRHLYSRLPQQHKLQCRSCGSGIPWDPVIVVQKLQGSLMKSLQSALEASFKCRLWCEKCQGYRDFIMSKSDIESTAGVVFIIDPSLYRQFHVLEEVVSFNKDQCRLHLKSLLAETHSHTSDDRFDLRAAIRHKKGQWLRCQNESINVEPLEASKVRHFALMYDREDTTAHKAISLDHSLLNNVKKGQLLAIDAEYVFYDKAQVEFHSDGSQLLVKPKKTRLARLSIVDGVSTERTLLDEYVALEKDEVIVDYCSHISGIAESDLSPALSKHILSSRRSLLVRLQGLIDAGCKFIGHGLANDFRVFNISIGGGQVLDTVKLFHLTGNRSLSLKFLAWHFFRETIQTDEHDSVIDAIMAAKLYHHYRELQSQRNERLAEAIEELYAVGGVMEWQPPKK